VNVKGLFIVTVEEAPAWFSYLVPAGGPVKKWANVAVLPESAGPEHCAELLAELVVIVHTVAGLPPTVPVIAKVIALSHVVGLTQIIMNVELKLRK